MTLNKQTLNKSFPWQSHRMFPKAVVVLLRGHWGVWHIEIAVTRWCLPSYKLLIVNPIAYMSCRNYLLHHTIDGVFLPRCQQTSYEPRLLFTSITNPHSNSVNYILTKPTSPNIHPKLSLIVIRLSSWSTPTFQHFSFTHHFFRTPRGRWGASGSLLGWSSRRRWSFRTARLLWLTCCATWRHKTRKPVEGWLLW